MERRNILLSTASVFSVGFAGCSLLKTGSSTDRPTLSGGLSVETQRWDGCVLSEMPVCNTADNGYNTIIPDRTTARNRLIEKSEIDTFIEETDFSESYVLLVQYRMQSVRWLTLRAIERTETGLRVGVTTESPDGSYADDAVPHTLAVRITDEKSNGPRRIIVSVDGKQTGTVGTSN